MALYIAPLSHHVIMALENKIMHTVKPLKIYINLFDSIIFNYNFYLKVDQQKVFA